jgi:hypothetical protein
LLIYSGSAFPAGYQGGAFIAFHGSWNRAPEPQGGYNVVFQPLKDGKAAGNFIVFADGFAGAVKEPGQAAFRPTGLAMAPDGALFISDDVHGRIPTPAGLARRLCPFRLARPKNKSRWAIASTMARRRTALAPVAMVPTREAVRKHRPWSRAVGSSATAA